MNIAIVVVTHNRLEYTKKCIPRLLEDTTEQFDLYLWDNASTDETPEYLKSLKDPRIVEVVLSKENVGQTGAMNYAWSKTKAELIGKLDNDCLVTPGWTRTFAQAHKDIENLGTVACWQFPRSFFDEKVAEKKIHQFNGHKIFRHPWTCGSGFIIKKKTFLELGSWEEGYRVGTTSFFIKMARAGYVNGWYYPLVLQEHIDDPVSGLSRFHYLPYSEAYRDGYGFKARGLRDMEQYMRNRAGIIENLLNGHWDVKYYFGWRSIIRRIYARLAAKLAWIKKKKATGMADRAARRD